MGPNSTTCVTVSLTNDQPRLFVLQSMSLIFLTFILLILKTFDSLQHVLVFNGTEQDVLFLNGLAKQL